MARSQNKLIDSFARNAIKLRISITDRCNMRCIYCMPTHNNEWFEQSDILAYDEIVRLAKILARLGFLASSQCIWTGQW
jgi:GTP 3',8-cyclase